MVSLLGLSNAAVLTLAVLAWLAVVALALAMAVVAARSERMKSEALREVEWLEELADMRSPSGKPFFSTDLDAKLLLESIADVQPGSFEQEHA